MPSPKLNCTLCLLTIALFLQTSFGADPLFHYCSKYYKNFTANSPYELQLKRLFGFLQYKTPPTGFGFGSAGLFQTAYGLSLCRGDVFSYDCETCITEASSEILKLCPYNKGATIWYDNCMFKYLDSDFFGHIDNRNFNYLWNSQSANESAASFNNKTKELLTQLTVEASISPKLYAAGELKFGESETIYGLTQCTRDLSSVDCRKCLYDRIDQLPVNCSVLLANKLPLMLNKRKQYLVQSCPRFWQRQNELITELLDGRSHLWPLKTVYEYRVPELGLIT